MDGTAVTAYIATALENKAVYKYVKYNGEFTVSGNYYDVVIAGTTTKGSVAYGKSEWASFNWQTGDCRRLAARRYGQLSPDDGYVGDGRFFDADC